MAILLAHGLSFSYGGAEPLFSDVNLHLKPGWYGLVGANGAGKSSLLALLAGRMPPETGHIQCSPSAAHVTSCAQIPSLADAQPARFAAI